MDLGLKNRSVIVAASSEGIARAAADRFAAEGAWLAMCSRDEAKLHAAAEEIRLRHGTEVLTSAFDVTDESAVLSFCRTRRREVWLGRRLRHQRRRPSVEDVPRHHY